MKRVAAAAIILSLTACATTDRFTQEPLPLPDRPHVPTVSADQLECLSDDAYEALATRDAQRVAHIMRLERIIRTTHPQ